MKVSAANSATPAYKEHTKMKKNRRKKPLSYNNLIPMSTHADPDVCCPPERSWYQRKVWWAVAASLITAAASLWIAPLRPFGAAFWEYLRMMAWPLGIGLVVGGLIERYVPREYILRFLARPQKRTVFYAASLGFLASACSHGILALSIELHKKGASGPAVISFLLASPWSNLPLTLLLIGFFGAKGILIIVSALVIAIVTGLVFQRLDRLGWIEKNKYAVASNIAFDVGADIKRRFLAHRFSLSGIREDFFSVVRGVLSLSEMILGWVVFGIVMASLAQAYIPSHFFQNYLGANFLGLITTLAFATVLEVCSEGTAPLAFEIYRQTSALGNSFVFMMAGVITDWTELGLVGSNLGKKTAFWMLAVGIPQILLLGWFFNRIF